MVPSAHTQPIRTATKLAAVGAVVALFVGGATIASLRNTHDIGVGPVTAADPAFEAYLQFISKFGKYKYTQSEFNSRFEVFKAKYHMIEEHNKLFHQGGPGAPQFTRIVNQFADLTDQEFMQGYTGLIVPKRLQDKTNGTSAADDNTRGRKLAKYLDHLPEWAVHGRDNFDATPNSKEVQNYKANHDANSTPAGEIPSYKNWYEEGAVTIPYDQAGCGGCWAFSTAAAVESLDFITGHAEKLREYSVQQLLDCDKQNLGCSGGWMYEGFEYVSKYGILLKDDYPPFMRSSNQQCAKSQDEIDQKAVLRNIGYVENDKRSNEQLREMVARQPISIGMRMTAHLNSYSNGIMSEQWLHCSDTSNEVNHGVLLIGYGTNDGQNNSLYGQCKDYWIIRNSWGRSYGEDGMFKLCADGYGDSETPLGTCLVNKYAVYPTLEEKTSSS